MVTATTAQDVMDHSGPNRPVVLTLDCTAAKYLSNDNDVLHIMFGVPLLRIDLVMGEDFDYYSDAEYASEHMIDLLKANPETSYQDMDRQIHDGSWLQQQVKNRIEEGLRAHATGVLVQYENVRVVFISQDYLEGESVVLHEALVDLFPNAAFFKSSSQGRPERIWNGMVRREGSFLICDSSVVEPPNCKTCGTPMRPAGSCFVCEGCGSTSGVGD